MKAPSVIVLGLAIVSVGAVVWWQIIAGTNGGLPVSALPPVVPSELPQKPEGSRPSADSGNETSTTTANQTPQTDLPAGQSSPVACTEEAKICPDGSAVGRTGPACEFAACPEVSAPSTVVSCTPEMRDRVCTKEYVPVCGLRQVQCVTTPCNPIPETFGNGCSACSDAMVLSYTAGACTQ